MNKTSYMKGREEGKLEGKAEGREEGVEQGRRKGVIEFLEAMLVNKFGPLPLESLDKLRQLPEADLTRIGLTFHSAASLTDLEL